MQRCYILSAFVALIVVTQVGAQEPKFASRQEAVAFVKEQFAAGVVPQAMRAELKQAIRAYLTEE